MCVFPAPVPLPISVSSFSLSCHDPSHLSLIVPLPCFHLPRFLFFFLSVPFLFVLFFLFSPFSLFSLHPLSFSVLFFPFPPSRACWRWVVFIGQRETGASLLPPYCYAWGAGLCYPATVPDEVANGCGWQGAAPLVFHHDGAWGIGFWQSTWQEGVKKKKTKVVFFPCCMSRGRRRRNSVAQNDIVLFLFLFLFKKT